MTQMSLIHEEAYYWLYSKHLALGYLDHPPMIAWLIAAGVALAGQNEFGVRLMPAVSSILTVVFSCLLCGELFGGRARWRAALLTVALPYFFWSGFLATPDAPLTAAWSACLFFLQRSLLRGESRCWIGAGVAMGFGLLSKYTIGLLGLATAAFMLLDRPSRSLWRRPHPYSAALLAVLIFSPVILWNFRNHWASFAFQTLGRAEDRRVFGLPSLIACVLILLTPCGVWAALKVLKNPTERISDCGVDAGRVTLWTRVFTLIPLGVFLLSSLARETKLNWTGPVWLAVIPPVAHGLIPVPGGKETGEPAGWRLPRSWSFCVSSLWGVYFICFFVVAFPLAALVSETIGNGLPCVWKGLALEVENIEKDLEAETGAPCLIAGCDRNRISSEMAFYDPEGEGVSEIAGQNLWGERSLMFETWLPAKEATGRNVIIVAPLRQIHELTERKIETRFDRLGPVREIAVKSRWGILGRFCYRIGYDYRSPEETES